MVVKSIDAVGRKPGTPLIFPQSRATVRRLMARPRVRAMLWWVGSMLALSVHGAVRGYMDNLGFPVHGAGLEQTLFGGLPTLWLQQHVFELWRGPLGWASAVVHASWFVVPLLPVALVALTRPERIGSLYRWWFALLVVALPMFALFPLQPPWMASGDVTRIIAIHLGGHVEDSNSLAAMPSMHVAIPLLTSLWFFRERWKTPAILMLGYSALVAFEVVFSGEHYVVDVMGAVVVAVGVMLLARLDYRAAFRRLSRAAARPATRGARPEIAPSPAAGVPFYRTERGQTLIEFAFIAPLIFIFLFTIVDFGIALDRRITLQHAMREGARAAGVQVDPAAGQQTAADQAQELITPADVDVCYIDEDGNGQANFKDRVKVSTSFTYHFTIPFGKLLGAIGIPVGGGIEMTPDATSALENDPVGVTFTECPP